MSYLNAGTKSHQLSGMSPQERGNPNEQVDAVLEKRLARELRARHAAQSMEMHELKTIVTSLKERYGLMTFRMIRVWSLGQRASFGRIFNGDLMISLINRST